MQKRDYELTPEQKQLSEGIQEWAKEKGLVLKTLTPDWNPTIYREVSKFIKRVEQAHEATKNSSLKFRSYLNSTEYPKNRVYAI